MGNRGSAALLSILQWAKFPSMSGPVIILCQPVLKVLYTLLSGGISLVVRSARGVHTRIQLSNIRLTGMPLIFWFYTVGFAPLLCGLVRVRSARIRPRAHVALSEVYAHVTVVVEAGTALYDVSYQQLSGASRAQRGISLLCACVSTLGARGNRGKS